MPVVRDTTGYGRAGSSPRLAGPRVLLVMAAWLVLGPGAAADEGVADSRLLVLGRDGRPATTVRRVALNETHEQGWIFATDDATTLRLPTDGVLPAEDVVAGSSEPFVLWIPGAAPVLLDPEVLPRAVRLVRAAPLEGRLRRGRGGAAADLEILAFPRGSPRLVHRTRTNEQGAWRLPHLPPGVARLAVRRSDGHLQDLGRFAAGGELAVTTLHRGAVLDVKVLDAGASRRTPVADLGIAYDRLPRDEAPPADDAPNDTTDAEGTLVIRSLDPGVYEARLLDPAFGFPDAAPRFEVPEEGRLALRPFFVRRRRAVRGTLADPEGRPVAGAVVHLLPDPHDAAGQARWIPVSPAVTDEAGAFRLEHVDPRRDCRVAVAAAGHAPLVSSPFEVGEAVDCVVPTLTLLSGWRLEARVRRPGGGPIANAVVRVVPVGQPVGVGDPAWDALSREALTTADGRAVLPDLPLDDLRVRVEHPEFLPFDGTVPYARTGDARAFNATLFPAVALAGRVERGTLADEIALRVRAVPREGASMRETPLAPDGAFRFIGLPAVPTDLLVLRDAAPDAPPLGRVDGLMPGSERDVLLVLGEPRRIEGRVAGLSPGGPPAEVHLEAPAYDPARGEHRWRRVATQRLPVGEPEASFTFEFLAPGAYAVRAWQGRRDTDVTEVFLGRDDVDGVALVLPEGGRIAGTVLDERDQPVLGATVRVVRLRPDGVAPDGAQVRVATDSDGEFVAEGLAAGLWRVEVSDGDLGPDLEILRLGDGESVLVRDLFLGRGGGLEIQLQDPDGRRLDGAALALEPLEEGVVSRRLTADAQGRVRVEHLRPGYWRLRLLSAAGAYTSLESVVEIVADEVVRLDLMPGGLGRIEGRVQRGETPAADALLHLDAEVDADGASVRRLVARTDERGEFRFDGLPSGRYVVSLLEGGARTRRVIELADGDHARIDVEAHVGRLPGRVVTLGGDPVGGALVTAYRSDGGASGGEGRVRTDPNGRFLIAGLPVGRYDMDVSAPGLPSGRLFDALAEVEGSERESTIVLGRGGRLHVHVTDRQGQPVGWARVWVEDDEGRVFHRRPYGTARDGHVLLRGVPTGRHWVRVHAPRYGRPARSAFELLEGETDTVRITVGPAARLEVFVSGGEDVSGGIRIALSRPEGGASFLEVPVIGGTRLDPSPGRLPASGVLTLDDLGAGLHVLRIDAGPEYEVVEQSVLLEAGETRRIGIQLARAADR